MRPAGRGEHDSLYFTYPTFAARRVPELDGDDASHKVAIVGAGPIGMTAALTLARYGVPCVLLDRKDTFNDGSRATCIARPSMQIFDRIGAVAPFVEKSLGWQYGRSYYREHQIFRLEMPHSDHDKYLPMYNLQQQYMETFLHDAVAGEPLIDMRWQSEVEGIETTNLDAVLQVVSPEGAYALHATYVVAADGARSPLRSMLGLRLKGENYEGKYVIADVQMAHDFPTERRAFFDPAGNPGGTVLIHKQPDDIWRVDYQLREGESETDAVKEENIRARVGAILGNIGHTGPWALEWWSIYTANTLALDDYRHGPVIFIGDSAHIVPIFGVRGLNNGIADAHNIGWKLGYVLNGWADAKLLDSYTPERRGATLGVFANATKSTRFMTPPSRGWALAREAALSLAISNEFTRGLANPRQMEPYTYADSPLTVFAARDADFASGPMCGAAAINVRRADGSYLLDQVGDGFAGLLFTTAAPGAAETRLLAALADLDPSFTAIVMDPDGADAALAEVYGAVTGTFYLLRPDLHVAGRWRRLAADEILRTLSAGLGGRTP
jgi:3-(3-hydroxy-phenyl)propionate hydroxylase